VFGRVPGTRDYRVIACSSGPGTRDACERELDQWVGGEVAFPDGARGKFLRAVRIRSGDGSLVRALELDRVGAPIAISPAGKDWLKRRSASLGVLEHDVLEQQLRQVSPRPVWATTRGFTVEVFEADLDGDARPDRVAIAEITDSGASGSRRFGNVSVSMQGAPFEAVGTHIDPPDVLGAVDLDGDGSDELLMMSKAIDPIQYEYSLYRVIQNKPLGQHGNFGTSEGWQPFDQLEDHDHSDE
jgi:hypothetical protein